MAMRSKWRGTLKLSLVQVPIVLFKSSESKSGVSFNTLHTTCGGRINQDTVCRKCNVSVPANEKAKGYEFEKNKYVTVTDADLEQFKLESTKTINITKVVPDTDISVLHIEESDFCAPDGAGAGSAFVVIRDSLRGLAAIGTVVTRGREDVVAVQPMGEGLVVHHLRYANEVRSIDDVEPLQDLPKASDLELRLAGQLVGAFKGRLNLSEFHDRYNEGVKAMLEAKATGTELPAQVSAPALPPAGDLMAALRASLDAAPAPVQAKAAPKAKKLTLVAKGA